MTSPSSTSSSDDFTGRTPGIPPSRSDEPAERTPRISSSGKRALALCLGVLLLLELGAARQDWLWKLDPRRPVGILLAVEDEIIAPAHDVRVAALGSSVMRDALLPREFEDAATLPEGSVLNLSLPNATPFDLALLYERNRERLATTRLLLVGIEDWFFYEEAGVSERYHRWATLNDRLTDYQGAARLPLLVSWAWKTYAARQAFAADGLAAAISGDRAEVIGADGRTRWRPEEQEVGPDAFDLAPYEARLRERVFHDRQARHLLRLVELAAADGIPVLVVRMPMRASAFRLRDRVDPAAESRLQGVLGGVVGNAVGAAGASVAGDTGDARETRGNRATSGSTSLLDIPIGTGVGLEERHFLDERHLGTVGGSVFTSYLASWAGTRYDLR